MPEITPDFEDYETPPADALVVEQAARIAELEAENRRLRAALAPFAAALQDEDVANADDDMSLYVKAARIFEQTMPIMISSVDFLEVRHLHIAAKALGKSK